MTTAVYILNRSYTRSVNNKTPYEVWNGKTRNLQYLYVKTARP